MPDLAALIVGGGPAGTAAAIGLASAGRPHLLVERTAVPADPLCGGFLSWRSLATLARLGIEPDRLNPRRVTHVRLFAGGRCAEVPLPQPGLGVSRRRLDALLVARAEAVGARVARGVTVRAIDGLVATVDDRVVAAEALFLASGKHEVRGSARPAPRDRDPALGLRVRIAADARLAALVGDTVELHLFRHGYAGVVVQEDGSANVCLALARSRLRDAGDPDRLLAELGDEVLALGDRLAGGWSGADAVANVPYGWRAADTRSGVFRLGDQAAVIPSLAGEGMGLALASGVRAAQAYLDGGPAAARAYQRAFHRATRRPVAVARLVRALAERPATARWLPVLARPALTRLVARLTRIGGADG